MARFTQHAYNIPVPKKGEKSKVHRIKTNPIHRDHELLSLVNQGGKIKLHALVDADLPPCSTEILVVGTGCEIDESLVNRIRKIGSLLLNDGQYGYHYYLVSPTEGAGETELSITLRYDDSKVASSDIEDVVTPYLASLRQYNPSLSFEGDDAVVLTFVHASVRQSHDYAAMMSELYRSDLIKGVSFN